MQHSTGQYDDLARVPRARPREGCRRRTTASRHRRHSPARCSCRVVPPIRDARLVDLNLAVCNSVARQERVCRAQRPAAKIDAIATSASGRDCTSAFEPAETPANCGLFLRDPETSTRIGLRGGAVIPTLMSTYLLVMDQLWLQAALATVAVAAGFLWLAPPHPGRGTAG